MTDTNVTVRFVPRTGGPDNLVCEAEIVWTSGILAGMKLVGLSLWRDSDGEVRVTFPSRAYSSGSERRFFAYLRSDDGSVEDVRKFKQWILAEYEARVERVA